MTEAEPWIVDADGHVVEPADIWDTYLPERFKSYAPHVVHEDEYFWSECNGRRGFRHRGASASLSAPGQTPHQTTAPVAVTGGHDPAARLIDMATDGIDIVALYPTFGLMIQAVTEREPALALCRAVNDWLADYCTHDRSRLIGVGTLPMADAGDALAEARRCVEELGFRAVWRRPEHFGSLPRLQDGSYEPLWSYLEEVDVPLSIHPGMNGIIPHDALAARFDDYYTAMHALHFVTEQMQVMTQFIAYGILERHPALRVAFVETGAMWALSYLHRLDEHLETFGFDRGALSMRPSDYFRRQCFVTVEEVEPGLDVMMTHYPESIVFSSDYPHADGTFPGSTKELLETDALAPDATRAILRDNALRLYSLA